MLKEAQKIEKVSKKARIGIIVSRFNKHINESMLNACKERLAEHDIMVDEVDVFWVPGAFEMPYVAQKLAKEGKYDMLITFGSVIKGDTYHFEMVANECGRGIMDVMVKHHIPIIFEVLATYNIEDAKKRAQNDQYNKGYEAAEAALAMIEYV